MYIQPYKDQWANILQTIVQVDILLMLAISSTDQFKVAYNQNYWRALYLAIYSKNAIDEILNWRF